MNASSQHSRGNEKSHPGLDASSGTRQSGRDMQSNSNELIQNFGGFANSGLPPTACSPGRGAKHALN